MPCTPPGEALSEIAATAHDAAVQAVQPRTFTRTLPGGGHLPLLDRQGNLVYLECPGLVDNAGITALGTAAWARSYLCGVELSILVSDGAATPRAGGLPPHALQPATLCAAGLPPHVLQVIDELSRRQGRLVLMFRCIDMTGFKMIKAFQSREEKEGERAFKEVPSKYSLSKYCLTEYSFSE